MKRNRGSAEFGPGSAGRVVQKNASENILVFLVIGLIILAVSTFARHPFFSRPEKMDNAAGMGERYVWMKDFPETQDGLYVFTQDLLQETFPDLFPPGNDAADDAAKTFSTVLALQYTSGPGETVALPPHVAHMFFRPIPINRAEKEILTALPGIGPVLPEKIVQRREKNGPFRSPDELLDIPGIGPKKLAGLRDHLIFD
jgi:competence ComEA-like helix-hairpin-helix protein